MKVRGRGTAFEGFLVKGRYIPIWLLILAMIAAGAAAVATMSGGLLVGKTEIGVAQRILIVDVDMYSTSDEPAGTTAVIQVAPDRQSFMVGFLADAGDVAVVEIKIINNGGTDALVKICIFSAIELEEEIFEFGLSFDPTDPGVYHGKSWGLKDVYIRQICYNEWGLYIPANDGVTIFEFIKISGKAPHGQYEVYTLIKPWK
jgi:hypothetical protein